MWWKTLQWAWFAEAVASCNWLDLINTDSLYRCCWMETLYLYCWVIGLKSVWQAGKVWLSALWESDMITQRVMSRLFRLSEKPWTSQMFFDGERWLKKKVWNTEESLGFRFCLVVTPTEQIFSRVNRSEPSVNHVNNHCRSFLLLPIYLYSWDCLITFC